MQLSLAVSLVMQQKANISMSIHLHAKFVMEASIHKQIYVDKDYTTLQT